MPPRIVPDRYSKERDRHLPNTSSWGCASVSAPAVAAPCPPCPRSPRSAYPPSGRDTDENDYVAGMVPSASLPTGRAQGTGSGMHLGLQYGMRDRREALGLPAWPPRRHTELSRCVASSDSFSSPAQRGTLSVRIVRLEGHLGGKWKKKSLD